MNRSLTILSTVAALTCSAAAANAQTTVDGFDVQSFKLAPAISANYWSLQQARVLHDMQYELSLMFNYANDPLVFYNEDDERDGAEQCRNAEPDLGQRPARRQPEPEGGRQRDAVIGFAEGAQDLAERQ